MYNCIIVDDDIFSVRILQQLLNTSNIKCIEVFTSPVLAIDFAEKNSVDIIFLDVQMPEVDGFEFIEKLKSSSEIILTTSFSNFALKAFENNVADYLTKPISKERLDTAIKRVIENIKAKQNIYSDADKNADWNSTIIKHNKKLVKINFEDLIYLSSNREYTYYHTIYERLITHAALKNSEDTLPKEHFIRIHKKYIINKKYIKEYNRKMVKLYNDVELPIGRFWLNNFLENFT